MTEAQVRANKFRLLRQQRLNRFLSIAFVSLFSAVMFHGGKYLGTAEGKAQSDAEYKSTIEEVVKEVTEQVEASNKLLKEAEQKYRRANCRPDWNDKV